MAGVSRTSASLLVGLALVCVLTLLGWWVLADGDAVGDCPVSAEAVDAEAQFVGADDLLPQGTVGERRAAVVEGLSGLGPLGEVEAGRFFDSQADVPALVPSGERLVLVSAPPDRPATLSAVDLAGGRTPSTDWTSRLSPAEDRWTSFTGGAVGDDWVAVFSGKDPAVLTLDGEGRPAACLEVPLDGGADVTAVTDQAGADVVVLASAGTAGWWLGVVDPATGEVADSRRAQASQTWQEVKVAGDLVVGSRWRTATIGTSGVPRPTDAQQPWVVAWGLDGEQRWTYPRRRLFPAVLLDQDANGTSYVVSFDRAGPWLDAVEADGRRLWRERLRAGEWSGSVWGDAVVMRGPDPRTGPRLRAFDVRDGSRRWVVRSRQAPPVGDEPRGDFGTPLTVGGAWWVPAPNGLLRIDRRTDEVDRVDSDVPVDELLRIGDRLVVRSGRAVLVTR